MKDYFELARNKSDLKTEVIAGITTFLATMYIIVVNPAIISASGMPFAGVLTATVLVSAFSSLAMGLYANNPIVMAPGMGINAFFTYTVVIGMGVKWETALGAVFWSGVIFILLSVFNIRVKILQAIPRQLRYAIAAGIGLFITFIGFENAKFIIGSPATLTAGAKLNPILITFVIGLLITSFLAVKKVKGALIAGIIITTLLSIPIGRLWGDASAFNTGSAALVTWKGFFAWPDFSLFLKFDVIESLKFSVWPVIFVFLFTDLFDSISTFIGVAEAADLLDESGEPRKIKESLIADAFSTMISGPLGTSSCTCYIESAAGVEEGGRTGLTAVVAGLLFLPFMFFSPLLSVIPSIATAPALILVGVFMMNPVTKIHWSKLDDAIPSFLGLVLIPLTHSITQGIIWGFISWIIIKAALGKKEDISITMIIIGLFALVSLFI